MPHFHVAYASLGWTAEAQFLSFALMPQDVASTTQPRQLPRSRLENGVCQIIVFGSKTPMPNKSYGGFTLKLLYTMYTMYASEASSWWQTLSPPRRTFLHPGWPWRGRLEMGRYYINTQDHTGLYMLKPKLIAPQWLQGHPNNDLWGQLRA